MLHRLPVLLITVLGASATLFADAAADGVAAYREANCKIAIPLLQTAMAATPKDAILRAALLSCLVYEGQVNEASDAFEADAEDFPDSEPVQIARAEFLYYMGDVRQAELLYRAVLKKNDSNARAHYGLYRLYLHSCQYRTARLLALKAYDLDKEDALIKLIWLQYAAPIIRDQFLPPFVAAHPWLYKNFGLSEATRSDVKQEMNGRKLFENAGEPQEVTFGLAPLMNGPGRYYGMGISLSIEGGKHLTMLLDTGASGIVMTQRAIDKIGLSHLGSLEVRGVGDKGPRNGFLAIADTCEAGVVQFKTCLITVLEGKHTAGQEDGLIGTDLFSDYLVEIDFVKRTLHLTPHPARPPNPQGYNRAAEPPGFTPLFRFGHQLYIPTRVNNKSSGLFLLDTGASISNIDSTFARLSTRVMSDYRMRVKGISGEVDHVFQADSAELQFANFRQSNLGLTAFNMNNTPDHQEIRMAGVLGFPILSMFRTVTLDYRNGAVKFDYPHR